MLSQTAQSGYTSSSRLNSLINNRVPTPFQFIPPHPVFLVPCVASQWDGVRIAMLHPGDEAFAGDAKENNRSCVLRVDAGEGGALLTGDIEREAERYLVDRFPASLTADVLVVPHHGSLTSSSEAFIDAVAPSVALFPVGYANRYGFPKPAVVARYGERGIQRLDSAHHGAIRFRLGAEPAVQLAETYRQTGARYWTAREPASVAP